MKEKSCMSCKHNAEAESIDDIPQFCWDCVSSKTDDNKLPFYTEIEESPPVLTQLYLEF